MFHRIGNDPLAFARASSEIIGPVEAFEHRADDLVLLQHHSDGFSLVYCGLTLTAGFSVGRQRFPQGFGHTEIVHHQAAGLIPEDPVDPGNGLHQGVAFHGLIQVHGVQRGDIEAGQPHIAHNDHSQRVIRVLEALFDLFALGFGADVRLPVRGSEAEPVMTTLITLARSSSSCHPGGVHELVVEIHGDAPAHGDDHGFAIHRCLAGIEVLDDVLGNKPQTFLGADQRFQPGPFGLQLLLDMGFLALGDIFKVGIDPGTFSLIQARSWPAGLRTGSGRSSCPRCCARYRRC